jgi:hypothetical protein
MGYLQLGRSNPRAYKGSRIQGFECNAKELQRFEKGVLGTLKKDITEIERMFKALIKLLGNESLIPGTLGPSSPTKLEKNLLRNHQLLKTVLISEIWQYDLY